MAVFGLGPVGLSSIILATAMGGNIIGLDIIDERLKLAEQAGAAAVVDVGKNDAAVPSLATTALNWPSRHWEALRGVRTLSPACAGGWEIRLCRDWEHGQGHQSGPANQQTTDTDGLFCTSIVDGMETGGCCG